VKLRVWVDTEDGRQRKSRVVKVASKEHGGRGQAVEKLEAFQAECEEAQKVQAKSVTLSELMTEYTTHIRRVGKARPSYIGCWADVYDDDHEEVQVDGRAQFFWTS
jgi:hypothetical protein